MNNTQLSVLVVKLLNFTTNNMQQCHLMVIDQTDNEVVVDWYKPLPAAGVFVNSLLSSMTDDEKLHHVIKVVPCETEEVF